MAVSFYAPPAVSNNTCLAPWNYNAASIKWDDASPINEEEPNLNFPNLAGINIASLDRSLYEESEASENKSSLLSSLWQTFQKIIYTLQSFDFYGKDFDRDAYSIRKEAGKLIPEYSSAEEFYKETKYVGRGSDNIIFRTRVSEKHPEMPEDMEIVLRIRRAESLRWLPPHIEAYARLSFIVDMTPYIPRMYGVYYAKAPSFSVHPPFITAEDTVICTEMEYVQQANRNVYDVMHSSSPEPRILFEEVIGTWAVDEIAKCNIDDLDGDVGRHHLQQYDPFPTVYRIGKLLYRFPPGLSARKIDYDVLGYIKNDGPFRVGEYSYIYDMARGTPWEKFVTDINSLGLFSSIKENFAEFQISETEFRNMGKNRTYFSIEQKYINK